MQIPKGQSHYQKRSCSIDQVWPRLRPQAKLRNPKGQQSKTLLHHTTSLGQNVGDVPKNTQKPLGVHQPPSPPRKKHNTLNEGGCKIDPKCPSYPPPPSPKHPPPPPLCPAASRLSELRLRLGLREADAADGRMAEDHLGALHRKRRFARRPEGGATGFTGARWP